MMQQFNQFWSTADDENAKKQGWNLFFAIGKGADGEGELQLQRIDDDMFFPSDADAWEFVKDRAREGDETAIRALRRLANEGNAEYFRVMKGG